MLGSPGTARKMGLEHSRGIDESRLGRALRARVGRRPAATGGRPMVMTTTLDGVVSRLSRELDRDFAGLVSAPVITACVADAIRDLRGSISGEALPEMAVRLARVRL